MQGMLIKHRAEEASPPTSSGKSCPSRGSAGCKGPEPCSCWAQETGVVGRNQAKGRNGAEASVLGWAVPPSWGLLKVLLE